jgi:zinc protease
MKSLTRKALLLASAFILIFAEISAQQGTTVASIDLTEKIPTDPKVKIGKLENGLTYYVQSNPKPENKVELRLAINAGSILEDDDQQGLAHFMEHMNFNGTTNFKKNELVDYLQGIGVKFGADLNAYTSFDQTVYILPIPSDDPEKLDKGFQILEDWAFNALLEDEEIDKERGVVLEELRIGKGADERMRLRYLPKMMYGSRYADRLPIGKKEIIENFDYDVIRRYHKDWYRPDLMVVIAVGDLDVETLEAKIIEYFGDVPAAKNPRERTEYDLPNHEETFISIESDPEASFSNVQIMYKDRENKKATETVKDFRDNLVRSLFAQMINNRLDELRNSPNPPFVFGSSYYGGTFARNKNAYQSSAFVDAAKQLEALETLLVENERVKRHGFFEGEFERAKKDLIANYERAYKDRDKTESGRIVGSYISNYLDQTPIAGIEWNYNMMMALLPGIKIEEASQLIENYIKEDNRVIILTGPEKEDLKKVTEKEVKDLLAAVEDMAIDPYKDDEVAEGLISNLPKKGSVVDYSINEQLDTKTLLLSNGVKVTYKITDFKNDEVLFDAFRYGGTSLYSDEDYLATANANGGLTEAGINGFKLNDINKILSGKIVNVRPSIGGYSENISGNATPDALEELFQLTHLYFSALNKDDEAFQSFVNKQKAFLGNILSNPQNYFQIELGKFLNEGNPRYVSFPTAESWEEADYDLAHQKYMERFSDASGFHFYFVGNLDEKKLADLCETYLASLPSSNKESSYNLQDYRPLTGNHKKVIKTGTDQKSNVRLIYNGPTDYNSEENLALRSLGEVLTIKLIEKLREEEGGVYGAGAGGSISKIPYGWYRFTISFPCGPENVDKLISAALTELDVLIKDGPTETDLNKVKESLKLKHKEDLKTNRYWLGLLRGSAYEQKDANNILEFEKNVENLTIADLQNVAEKYLSKGHITAIQMPED